MSARSIIFLACLVGGTALAEPRNRPVNPTEQEIVNSYLKKTEQKHRRKLGFVAGNFSVNRINRGNDYNSFANSVSSSLTGGEIAWLDLSMHAGAEMGMKLSSKMSWGIGGEYWFTQGSTESGSFTYDPPSGPPVAVQNLQSEINVYGFTTSASYFLMNPPVASAPQTGISLYVSGMAGFYHASWALFDEYQELNLATAGPEAQNAKFTGTAPGFGINLGMEYPLNFGGLSFGAKAGYFHLNFNNMSWYNGQDEEIVVSFDGTDAGRVDLDFSGVRGGIELKRYFSW